MRPIDFLLRSARARPDKVAVSGPEGRLTFAGLVRRAQSLACALQELAPDPRARIAICGGNHVAHVVALFATLLAGRIWVPLNPRAGKAELNRIIEFTEAGLVIAQRELASGIEPGRAPMLVYTVEGDRGCELSPLIRKYEGCMPRDVFHDLGEIQAIKFTGGTTGVPKGVMQTYRSWNTMIASFLHAMQLRDTDRYLAAAPITHGTSTLLLPVLGAGGSVVLAPSTRPRELLDVLERERITTVFLPPTLVYMLLEDETAGSRDWSALRHFIHAAAPMRSDKIIEAQCVFGAVATGYGQTEAPAAISFLSPEEYRDPRNLQSVGRPTFLTEVRIKGPDGAFLPAGESGEVVVRGDLVMAGYWRQPEKTAETIRDGWLHTGDVGFLDERGYLFLKDRLRDVIITGGFNVYPTDVENVLGQHPAVHDCVVVGVDDPKWGEAVHALVEVRKGAQVGAEELVAWVRSRLDAIKTPKAVHFIDALPRTANGKVSRVDAKRYVSERVNKEGSA